MNLTHTHSLTHTYFEAALPYIREAQPGLDPSVYPSLPSAGIIDMYHHFVFGNFEFGSFCIFYRIKILLCKTLAMQTLISNSLSYS